MELDSASGTAFYTLIPGEGIVANDGIFVGVPANIAATVFYG
jgi:hypothetical protein